MAKPMKVMDEKKFDYEKFDEDLKRISKEKKKSVHKISEEICLRSGNYLCTVLKTKRLPANIAVAIASWAEMDMKNYEIKKPAVKKEEKKSEEAPPVEASAPQIVQDSGWSCAIKVDEEFGMAMMKIFKDGKEIALGRSYTYGHDDVGIVQGISYAAHMCYKLVEQAKIATESANSDSATDEPEDDDELVGSGVGRVVFKDWIKKYEKDNSKAGRLARFIASNYQNIPSTGKKKIRMYIRLNKGETHLTTFDSMWHMYFAWYNSQYNAENIKIGVAQ